MHHLRDTAATTHQLHGVTFHSFAASHSGATRIAAWRAEFPAQTPGTPHRMTEEEVLYVLTGSLHVEIDDDRFTASAGDAVLVPTGATFRISNTADTPATAWVTTTIGMRAVVGETTVAPPWAQ